jgi:hypothetical protein
VLVAAAGASLVLLAAAEELEDCSIALLMLLTTELRTELAVLRASDAAEVEAGASVVDAEAGAEVVAAAALVVAVLAGRREAGSVTSTPAMAQSLTAKSVETGTGPR